MIDKDNKWVKNQFHKPNESIVKALSDPYGEAQKLVEDGRTSYIDNKDYLIGSATANALLFFLKTKMPVGKYKIKSWHRYTRGGDVIPKYSDFWTRRKKTPLNGGKWNGARGDSKWTFDKNNRKGLKNHQKSIKYKNGMPDFSEYAKSEIKLDMSKYEKYLDSNTIRDVLHRDLDTKLANKWSTKNRKWTQKDVRNWRKKNKYTWNELNDRKTVQLIPRQINDKFLHFGGIGEFGKPTKKELKTKKESRYVYGKNY